MPNKVVSGKKPTGMQVLGTNTNSILYWDFSDTEDFYWMDNSNASTPVFYRVSPKFAYTWFSNNPSTNTGVTIAYNPFLGMFQSNMMQPSDIV